MRKLSAIVTLCLLTLIAASVAYAVGVRGTVVDGNGSPKDLVKVDFAADQGSDPVATAWTDDYGNFGVDVPPGKYQVTVSDGEEGGDRSVIPVTVDASGTLNPKTLTVNW